VTAVTVLWLGHQNHNEEITDSTSSRSTLCSDTEQVAHALPVNTCHIYICCQAV